MAEVAAVQALMQNRSWDPVRVFFGWNWGGGVGQVGTLPGRWAPQFLLTEATK